MYESRRHAPLPRRLFVRRLLLHFLAALALLVASLLIGMVGYAGFEGLDWRDAFLNAAMLLGSMGPVEAPHTDAGKLFAGCYALYAGLIFLIMVGIMASPILHRVMHLFHWESES